MPTPRECLASLAGLVVLTSCAVGSLFDAPPSRVISVTPTRVVASAAEGDGAMRDTMLVITSASRDSARWTAQHDATAAWLTLGDSNGSTPPDTLRFTLDPNGLAPAVYRDTITIYPSAPGGARVRVPVELRIVDVATPPPPPPPPATSLQFTRDPPGILALGASFSVEVTAYDAQGGTATGFGGVVTLSLQGPIAIGGSLQGQKSVTAVNGIATFNNLSVTGLCTGCTLVATAPGLSDATSGSFSVLP